MRYGFCICGKSLKGRRPQTIHCSSACRQRAYRLAHKRPLAEKVCPCCRSLFKPRSAGHRYATLRCVRKAHRTRRVRLAEALVRYFGVSEKIAHDVLDGAGMHKAKQLIPMRFRMEVLYPIGVVENG